MSISDYQAYGTRRVVPLRVSREGGFLSRVSFVVDLSRRENRTIKRGSASERFGWNHHVPTHISPIAPFHFFAVVQCSFQSSGEKLQATVPQTRHVVPPMGGSTAIITAHTTARGWDLDFLCRVLWWCRRVTTVLPVCPQKMGGCSNGS